MYAQAKKEGKSEAEIAAMHQNDGAQIVWKDQVNPYYNQNQLFEVFMDPEKQRAALVASMSSRRGSISSGRMASKRNRVDTQMTLNKDTLAPLKDTIDEAERAIAAFNSKFPGMNQQEHTLPLR